MLQTLLTYLPVARVLGVVLGGLIGVFSLVPSEATERYDEQVVKLAFLYKLSLFIEWPALDTAAPANAQPLHLCLYQAPLFSQGLDFLSTKQVRGRPLSVTQATQIDKLKDCHILFVGRSATHELPAILTGLGQQVVLTVGETADFTKQGGVVALLEKDGSIEVELNITAAKKLGLTVDPRLLQFATLVE